MKKNGGLIVGIGITVLTGGTGGIFTSAFGAFWGTVASGAAAGFGAAFTNTVINGGSIGNAFSNGLKAGIVGGLQSGMLSGIDNLIPGWISSQAKSKLSIYSRVAMQGVNSIAKSTVNGVFSSALSGSFRKSFFNSLFWEGIEFTNEVVMTNFSNVEGDNWKKGEPTFKPGKGYSYKDPANNEFGRITNFDTDDVGLDIYCKAGTKVPNLTGSTFQTGSWLMRRVNQIWGMNFHAHVHDSYMTMIFETYNIKNSFITLPINMITEAPFMYINYGVSLNHQGMLNTYQQSNK